MKLLCWTLLFSSCCIENAYPALNKLPVVVNTWPFVDANEGAVVAINNGESCLDAVEKGCTVCEMEQCDGSVGFGGSPNEDGETTLDAMIMDGETHDVGAVGCIKQIKTAISVARQVMERTQHTILVGDDATAFAVKMGFKMESLTTDHSRELYTGWKENSCQPNYWKKGSVLPDPTKSCGPYQPNDTLTNYLKSKKRPPVDEGNHDTIGLIVVDTDGKIACGTSTNGASHKIPGRVGDSPIVGAGCYVEKGVGGAAGTGDGDVMMRFLPAYDVVQRMSLGMSPQEAAEKALEKITKYYPSFVGALIAVNTSGDYGAANHGFSSFHYTVYNPVLGKSTVIELLG